MMQDQRGSGIPFDRDASAQSVPEENRTGVKNVSWEEFAAEDTGAFVAGANNPRSSTNYQVGGFIDPTDPAFAKQQAPQPAAPAPANQPLSEPAAPVVLLQTGETAEKQAAGQNPAAAQTATADAQAQTTRKGGTSAGSAAAATSKQKSPRPTGKTTKPRKRGLSNSARNAGLRRIVIILIVAFVAFDLVVVAYIFLLSRGEPPVYYNQPTTVISKYVMTDGNINEIAYDQELSELSFANFPNLTITNTASLKLIDNNKYRALGGPNGTPLFYDDLIINRIMQLNNNWVNYLNNGDTSVFESVREGSAAHTKLSEWGTGYQVAYHRLVFGELRYAEGVGYFIITQATYTLAGGGKLDQRDDVIVFRLQGSGNTLRVTDMEFIPFPTRSTTATTAPADSGAGGSVSDVGTNVEAQGAEVEVAPATESEGVEGEGGGSAVTPEGTPGG